MNKSVILFLVFSLLIIPSVSADTGLGEGLKNAGTEALNVLRPLFEFILGAQEGGLIAGQVLLLIIVFSVLYALLDSGLVPFFDSGFAKWVVPLAVSILGVRFLPPSFIDLAALPSGAFGVAVTALLPIIGFFFITRGFTAGIAQRASWILLAVFFIGLWSYRSDELIGSAYWVYPLAAVACLVMMLSEGIIADYASKGRTARVAAAGKAAALKALEDLRTTIATDFARATGGGTSYVSKFGFTPNGLSAYKQDMKEVNKRIDAL